MLKNDLQEKVNRLISQGRIQLGELLAGGVVSDVYSASWTVEESAKNIVVKHTKKDIAPSHIFSKADVKNSFSKAILTHNFDVEIQKALKTSTPVIIEHFPKENITLMENFNDKGYTLLQELIISEKLPNAAGRQMGKKLAALRKKLTPITEQLNQVESSLTQFDERFYELKALLYNGRIDIFNEIENTFLSPSEVRLTWTDGDQKNFAVNEKGEVIIFDLGRMIKCDPDFMLPNLLGHLGLFYIAGYLENGTNFLKECTNSFLEAYNPDYKLNEKKFVDYFTAAVLHRGMAMRWIDKRIGNKIGEDSIKNASMHLGDIVFNKEKRIENIENLFSIITKIRKAAISGLYKRTPIKI